jgi:hypothetical protein
MDDLATLLPISRATWLLVVAGITTLAFALSAFACDRLGHTIISPFLAAGAWLSGAFAVLVWFWREPRSCLAAASKITGQAPGTERNRWDFSALKISTSGRGSDARRRNESSQNLFHGIIPDLRSPARCPMVPLIR